MVSLRKISQIHVFL